MFRLFIVLLGFASLSRCAAQEDGTSTDTLQLLHVLFRHGNRTPDRSEVYPKDPHRTVSYYPIGYGELTNAGKLREYSIGKTLRSRYDKFLGIYSPDVLIARTTDYNRTKVSCELVLAGLYPPSAEQQWNNELNWQPIPYHYEKTDDDHLLGDPRDNCPAYQKLYNQFLYSDKGRQLYSKNSQIYDYVAFNTGWEVKEPKEVYNLFFVLTAEEDIGFKLPSWTKKVWPKNITEVATEEYYVSTATTHLKRLSGGFFLQKLVRDTQAKINGEGDVKNLKLFMYSAHENNIAYFLTLLNIFHPHMPPLGAYVIVEVHKIDNVYGLKIYYQDYRSEAPRLLKLPGCEKICPFDKFIKLVEEYFPTEQDVCSS